MIQFAEKALREMATHSQSLYKELCDAKDDDDVLRCLYRHNYCGLIEILLGVEEAEIKMQQFDEEVESEDFDPTNFFVDDNGLLRPIDDFDATSPEEEFQQSLLDRFELPY